MNIKKLIFFYLIAFIAANLIVKHYGSYGMWFSSFFLIPFDFVSRCIIHEKYKGYRLIIVLSIVTILSSLFTIAISWSAKYIALASICSFTVAQITSGLFYQYFKDKKYWFKVNGSDAVGIIFDSIVFQYIAFSSINPGITVGQIVIKFIGGALWYIILFKWVGILQKKPEPTFCPKPAPPLRVSKKYNPGNSKYIR